MTLRAVEDVDGRLVVGGNFTAADSVADARYVVSYRDDEGWRTYPGLDGAVNDVVGFVGALVAGGEFSVDATSQVAFWNGVAWEPLGVGFDGPVDALAVFEGTLYAGGRFQTSGGEDTPHLATWDGLGWNAVSGAGASGPVYGLDVAGGRLYATGDFHTAGGVPAHHVARYDGADWSALGEGLDDTAHEVVAYDGSIYVLGMFTNAGDYPSHMMARWRDDPLTIDVATTDVRPQGDAAFRATWRSGAADMRLTLPADHAGALDVYDATGRHVRRLAFESVDGAAHIRWSGRDASGHDVATGVYFLRATFGTEERRTRLVVTR